MVRFAQHGCSERTRKWKILPTWAGC